MGIKELFLQRGCRPFGTPLRHRKMFIGGTYHPFLGKDVTMHIHSSKGEICTAFSASGMAAAPLKPRE